MTQVRAFPDHASASRHLHLLLVQRWGLDPDILDSLEICVLDCPHEGSDARGKVIAASPRGMAADPGAIVAVYYGDFPPGLEIAP